jgi:hypothetical protein
MPYKACAANSSKDKQMQKTQWNVMKMGVLAAGLGVLVAAFYSPEKTFGQDVSLYEVIVTNLTRGQQFMPIVLATSEEGVPVLTLGSASSPELAVLAEEGNTEPLAALWKSSPGVFEVTTSTGVVNPGASVRLTIRGGGKLAHHFSLASKLSPTNDAFIALDNVEVAATNIGATLNPTLTVWPQAYDSGTERNDELCASIPGPFFVECNGAGGGGMPAGGEEGYVYIHSGIHGVGNLSTATRDWNNPVARIVIRKAR